jgi:hypothetical protein
MRKNDKPSECDDPVITVAVVVVEAVMVVVLFQVVVVVQLKLNVVLLLKCYNIIMTTAPMFIIIIESMGISLLLC